MQMINETDYHGSDRIFPDNSAVSTIVGAILVFGLLVAVAAFVNVYYVPSWVADDEARHAQDVFVDFSAIPGHIDELVLANNTDAVSRQRIELGCGGIPIMSPGMSWGSLGTVPQEGNFTVKADVWAENITKNNASNNLTEGEYVNITNVYDMPLLQIYTLKPKIGSIFINLTNQSVTDQNGRAEIHIERGGYRSISSWDGDGNKIIDKMIITTEWPVVKATVINLLYPCYGFSKVLNDMGTPYNLTITTNIKDRGNNISYGLKYSEYNRGSYAKTSNGTLVYESMNRYFLNQKFIYQNGAVFLCQPPDASMRIAPDTIIEDVGNYTWMTIPMVTVGTGVNRTPMIGGSGVEELQMGLKYVDRITFADRNNTESVSIIIEPPEGSEEFRENYLREWANYFNATVAGSSVEMSSINATNWTDINITLTGKIHLEIKEIEIEGRIASIT